MIKDKLKALLSLTGKTQTVIKDSYDMSLQNFNNKFRQCRFSLKDLIVLANATDTQLAFIDKNGDVVVKFDINDIQDKETE